ncbi:MAG: hypothetical protein AB8F65_07520 [Woeseiaceae bacterium]
MQWTNERLLAAAPAIFGVLIVLVSTVDRFLFDSGLISVKAMLTIELPLVVLGFVVAVVLFCASIIWAFGKRWKLMVGSLISVALFFFCFIIGGINGAAYLNAT